MTPWEELAQAVDDLVGVIKDTFRPVLDGIKRAGGWIVERFL